MQLSTSTERLHRLHNATGPLPGHDCRQADRSLEKSTGTDGGKRYAARIRCPTCICRSCEVFRRASPAHHVRRALRQRFSGAGLVRFAQISSSPHPVFPSSLLFLPHHTTTSRDHAELSSQDVVRKALRPARKFFCSSILLSRRFGVWLSLSPPAPCLADREDSDCFTYRTTLAPSPSWSRPRATTWTWSSSRLRAM